MDIVRLGHNKTLFKLESTWIQDPGSSPKFLCRLSTNTMNIT